MDRARNIDGTYAPIHGMKKTRIYSVWCAMRERCNNPHNKRYDRYGARGIKVTDEWNSFENFYKWAMDNGYKEGLTIDRKNNDGMYEPLNCRWVTRKEQNRNYSRNHLITYNGETHCIAEWGELTGVNPATIRKRLINNKPLEEVFSPIDRRLRGERI